MQMKVKEVSNLTGISVRTLHHYDEIGLLNPDHVTESGYRIYSQDNIETLQQILFFRELGFSLKKIQEIISSPSFDRQEALLIQRKMLVKKRCQLDKMIETIDRTIKYDRGEIEMSNKEKFEGFDFKTNPYEEEARHRWGDKAVDNANAKLAEKGRGGREALSVSMNKIYKKLAELREESPASEEAQAAIREWYDFLNDIGDYSLEAFKGLGEMYVYDQRFTKNIDQFGEGLAVFMRDAMAIFADNN